MKNIVHDTDLCVVGGGLSGVCAAIAAARLGIRVVIMQDRPMFGGNASSEIRMWICGALGENNRETGLVEEIILENSRINPMRNYHIWDGVLYEKVAAEQNIEMLLNCACCKIEMDGGKIKSVTGYQTTTQQWHTVNAKLFCDCSGDSVLAAPTGALYRKGRESRSEFDEDIAPEKADTLTMGMSCLIQLRNTGRKSVYIPPERAYKYTKENISHRLPRKELINENFWYLELGGTGDSVNDTEKVRDELLRTAWGLLDFIKNSGEYDADEWEVDWIGILPGKRESLRYVGDYIMTQKDVRSGGMFEDIIAYGGWTMDDHHPGGFHYKGEPTIFHPAPSPYGIAYRCIYSKNIDNLLFAGRNISVTHSALSSTRVMATCALLGQAAGTAAYVAVANGVNPRGVYEQKTLLAEVQRLLTEQDCFLPRLKRRVTPLTEDAEIDEKYEALRNGHDRPTPAVQNGERVFDDNGVIIPLGDEILFKYKTPQTVSGVRFVFDSDLNRRTVKPTNPDNVIRNALSHNMTSGRTVDFDGIEFAETMTSDVKIDILYADSVRETVYNLKDNRRRLVNIQFGKKARNVKEVIITPLKTTGKEEKYKNYSHIFSIDIL